MKKILVILIACLMVTGLSAQSIGKKTTTSASKSSSASASNSSATVKQGSILVNSTLTNLSYNSSKVGPEGNTESYSTIGLQLSGGYAYMDDLVIVASAGYQNISFADSDAGIFNIVAGARYYVIPNVFAGAGLSMATISVSSKDDEEGTSNTKGHSYGVNLSVGYSYFLTPNIALEPSFSYTYGFANEYEKHDYDMSGLSLNIGFSLYF